MNENSRFATAIRRRLQGIAAVLRDPAATEHEKANAASLKMRLEKKLPLQADPEGSWMRLMFQLGRTVRAMKQSPSSSLRMNARDDRAFRLGRALRQWKRERS